MSKKPLLAEQDLFIQFAAELDKESDRALVIVAAAYLDYLLELLISNKFKLSTKKQNDMFKHPSGMLHSFSSRIMFAHMTSLIAKMRRKI